MIIVGLDPALNSPGFGVLRDGVIVHAARVPISAAIKRLPIGDRIEAVAAAIATDVREAIIGHAHAMGYTIDTLVWELPQVYGGPQETDPNDLIVIAAVAAAAVARLKPSRVIAPKPREWTAGTSKNKKGDAWDSSRGRRLKLILRAEEVAVIGTPAQHDALDGVGLALHPTERALARPRRVYPGASPRRTPPVG